MLFHSFFHARPSSQQHVHIANMDVNQILRYAAHNGLHRGDCFCSRACRATTVAVLGQHTEDQMFQQHFNILPAREDAQLNELFYQTMRKVAFGVAFHIKILSHNLLYSSFGAALNVHPQYCDPHYTYDERKDISKKIRAAKQVYDDWDKIVANAINSEITHVDLRKFSIDQLGQAKNFSWLVGLNDKYAAKKRKRRGPPEPNFSDAKIAHIMAAIVQSGIIQDVSGDVDQLDLISKRLLEEMKKV